MDQLKNNRKSLMLPPFAWLALFLLLMTATSFAGFQRLFSSFAFYDDEGYVMLSLRQFLAGRPLYDDVYSQYGPAYYLLESLVHRILEIPVSHDVTRFKTLLLWLLVSAMSGWYLHRMTKSPIWAAVGCVLAFCHLDRLSMEPGHPQEICLFGLMITLLLSTFLPAVNRFRTWSILGALGVVVGVVIMTKVNFGALLFLAAIAAMLRSMKNRSFASILLWMTALAMLALPLMIVREHLFTLRGMQLPVVTIAGLISILALGRSSEQHGISLSGLMVFGSAVLVSAAAIAFFALSTGISPDGLAHGVLLQHLGFVDSQYRDPPLFILSAFFAVATLVAVFMPSSRRAYLIRLIRIVCIAVAIGVIVRQFTDTFTPLTHGGMDRGHALLMIGIVVPCLWLLLLPRSKAELLSKSASLGNEPSQSKQSERVGRQFSDETQNVVASDQRFARLFLCFTAVLMPLTGYPMPGTQMAIASLPILFGLMICLWEQCVDPRWFGGNERLLRFGPILTLIVLCFVTLSLRCVVNAKIRFQNVPLNLPGAHVLRLPEQDVAEKRWTVGMLQSQAKSFVCLPAGYCSIYLWSEIEPPTGLNTTDWARLLTDKQQVHIIDALEKTADVWVVHDPRRMAAPKSSPLVRYLNEHFSIAEKNGAIELWNRN